MADYNPFQRGPAPVGTRGYSWTDTRRQHTMPVDVWYPATDAYQGQDLDPQTMAKYEMVPGMGESTQMAVKDAESVAGEYPLVVFSHGFGGERRQSTFFYSHLASHGYVVAAMDHVGNTTVDMISGEATGGDPAVINRFIQSRPMDASFVIDQMLAGEAGLAVSPDQIGMSGHSFGGWTTLKTLESDDRIKAALALAPAGGYSASDPESAMARALNFSWGRVVPTLYLVAEFDSILPLDGMQDLYRRSPEPKTTVVLSNADHFHFNDNIEESHDGFKMMMGMMAAGMEGEEQQSMQTMLANMKASSDLVPGSQAYMFINGLGLAHFDAILRKLPEAAAMLSSDLVSLMADRNVAVNLLS